MDIRRIWALLILSMQHEDIVRDVLTNIRHTWQRNEVLRFVQSLGLIKLSLSYVPFLYAFQKSGSTLL